MKKYILLLLPLLFLAHIAFPCLNGARKQLMNGSVIYHDAGGIIPGGRILRSSEKSLRRDLQELDSLYKSTKYLNYLSDKGLVFIILGEYQAAIDLYLEIEKLEPNRYSTASNIGTAYELIGENEKALYWIKKAVEIDPSLHENSEWIHINILEAKIKGENYYTTHHLLNTDFGTEKKPASDLSKKELIDLQNALRFQLTERMTFVKPVDKIVAQLLFDMGNITFLLGDHLVAVRDYELAIEYGFNENFANRRHAQAVHRVLKAQEPFDFRTATGFLFLGVSAVLLVYYLKSNNTVSHTS